MSATFLHFLREFSASMPSRYRARHDASAMADHARLAFERAAPVRVGRFRTARKDGEPLSIVADDRPGLLSHISAALVTCQLDVVSAEAYTRPLLRGAEAVDLFWLKHHVSDDRVVEIEELLIELITGRSGTSSFTRPPPPSAASVARVRFLEQGGAIDAIDVETNDRPGLLHAISTTLFALRLQITGTEARTIQGRAFDRFYVRELDGAEVRPFRRHEVEEMLLATLGAPAQALKRRATA